MVIVSELEDLLARADELATDRGRLLEAIALLEDAVHLAPRATAPTLRLSDAWRRLPPNHDEGNDARHAAIAFAMRGVWLAPDDPDAHLALARALHRQHWFRLSIEHLRRSWELESRAVTAFWMGWMLSEIGELDEDLVWLEKAGELDPGLPGLHAELGYAYRVLERNEDAEHELRAAIEKAPADDYAHGNLVLLLIATDRPEDAIAHGDSLLLGPDASLSLVGVAALARWLAGDRNGARPVLERIIDADRSVAVGTWGTHAVDLQAEILWHAGDRDRAVALLSWSTEHYGMRRRRASEGWGFRLDLARIAALQGDQEAALAWLRETHEFGWYDVALARRDPMLAALRGEPRFEALLDEVSDRLGAMRRRWETARAAGQAGEPP
jgi:tetratricopeptide (TPR) repeat protein